MPSFNFTSPQIIDLQFLGVAGSVASYLLDTGDGLALVDTGPTTTLSALQAGLASLGVSLADIRHILLTHIHFDHAGAAGAIAAQNPDLRVYVHARGARHLISPARLIASATQIYGDQMDRLWGDIQPLNAEQVVALEGGERILGGRVQALYTPGHAVHHLAYHTGADLFVGDVGGIRLSMHQTPRTPTPPPDIDLELWHGSIAALRLLEAETLHLAHFGSYRHDDAHWDALSSNLETQAAQILALIQSGLSQADIIKQYTAQIIETVNQEEAGLGERYLLASPPFMDVQGLQHYFKKKAII